MSEDINADLVLNAYLSGIFPMGSTGGQIKWYSPDPRCIIELDNFHFPKRLARTYRQGKFTFAINTSFDAVIRNCATRGRYADDAQASNKFSANTSLWQKFLGTEFGTTHNAIPGDKTHDNQTHDDQTHDDQTHDDQTWITEDIIKIYTELHHRNYAHSVEAYIDGELAGGLYGVAIGGAFMGESMFHKYTDASKVSLIYLIEHLKKSNYVLLDCQYMTEHLRTFGASLIYRDEYLKRLRNAIRLSCTFN